MEYENPTRTGCLNSDIISTLPPPIIENILSLIPLGDALRTSILAKKWRYIWRSMPKLVFTDAMVKLPSGHCCEQLEKYKLVNAIFHVLLLHNGPTILEFNCSVGLLLMKSEFAQIISYLAKGNKLKELMFINDRQSYKLPVSFFSLQGLERIHLKNCTFEPPLTFNGFSLMTRVAFVKVQVSAHMLQLFLSKCPLLEYLCLIGSPKGIDFVARENKFTFVDLLRCVPLIETLQISKYYMKYLSAGGMPHKLPTSLARLKNLYLDMCMTEENEFSSALCLIMSSPLLEKIDFMMCDNEKLPTKQTPPNFLDPEDYLDLKLDHLETLLIQEFRNLPLEMEFVKLIMSNSPVLKKVHIKLNRNVSVDEELKILREMLLFSFPRAYPYTRLIIDRPKSSL